MTDDRESRVPAVPEPEMPDRPRVVDEAYEVLGTYTWQTAIVAVGGIVAWGLSLYSMGPVVPLTWLIAFLAVVFILYFSPVSREPKLAREVIHRWDELRVERALGSAGLHDPRLEVAHSMADRVLRHPSTDERTRSTTRALVRRLEVLIKDARRVEWLADARSAADTRGSGRSISDLMDVLDARIANVLGQITEIHRTVVLRDAIALERALVSVDEFLEELEAEREVERLLAEAEGG